jgi:hypothetical protein
VALAITRTRVSGESVDEINPIVLGADLRKPSPHVASQDQRVVDILLLQRLVGKQAQLSAFLTMGSLRALHFWIEKIGAFRPCSAIVSCDLKALGAEMARLLDLIDAEWRSDPTSVASFDLRVVEEVRKVLAELS